MHNSGTPLARKLPERLKKKLAERQLNYEARSPAASRQARVAEEHERLLVLKKLRSAQYNQRVKTSKVKQDMKNELDTYRTAITSEIRLEAAEARRRRQLQNTVERAAAQNEASRQHAIGVERLKEAKQQNQMLRQMHAQVVADQRRREYTSLKSQAAAIHNERVALTKDYVRISDYMEEVQDEDDEFSDDLSDTDRRRYGTIESASGDDGSDDGDDGIGDDYDDVGEDQWSNAVNYGDEESYADSYYTRGSSTGGAGFVVGGDWDLGRRLMLNAYTAQFRRTVIDTLVQ